MEPGLASRAWKQGMEAGHESGLLQKMIHTHQWDEIPIQTPPMEQDAMLPPCLQHLHPLWLFVVVAADDHEKDVGLQL